MQLISSLWWAWLICMLVFGGYGIFNQFRRMKRMMGGGRTGRGITAAADDFWQGLVPLVISWLLASASCVLFVIAILYMIIHG